jgi:hypothetical protein
MMSEYLVTMECSVCHRGIIVKQNTMADFFMDVWTGLEYCQDHKPSGAPSETIGFNKPLDPPGPYIFKW